MKKIRNCSLRIKERPYVLQVVRKAYLKMLRYLCMLRFFDNLFARPALKYDRFLGVKNILRAVTKIPYIAALLTIMISCVVKADTTSNISIATAGVHTVTGIYLQALYAGSTCSGGGVVFTSPASSTFGAMWTGGLVLNNQTIAIGANYLYEMLTIAIYEGYEDAGGINSPTTPGANSYNSGSNAWCIRLGIAGGTPVVPNASVTTSLLAFGDSNSISITCNDTTKSCSAAAPTTQNF